MLIRIFFFCLFVFFGFFWGAKIVSLRFLAVAWSLSFQMAWPYYDGMQKTLQIPIVLPSLCFLGNSLLPSGRPSSLSSSHFPLMGFSSVLFTSHFVFLSVLFLCLFSKAFFSTLIWFSLLFLALAFSHTFNFKYLLHYCALSFVLHFLLFILLWSFHLIPCPSLPFLSYNFSYVL